jgi:hypothetical protein
MKCGCLALALLLVALINTVPIASNDLWLQVKIGELTMEHRAIPGTLLFPFPDVRDNAFTAHEWLPSIAVFELARLLGSVERLMFVQGLVSVALFGICFALARRLSGSFGMALLLSVAAMLVANFRCVLRPEIFALLLLAWLLAVLTRYRDERRSSLLLWCLPIAILWANCHGSFLLGPAVSLIFACGEGGQAAFAARGLPLAGRLQLAVRAGAPYVAASVAMALASAINPHGIGLLRFAFDVQSSQAMRTMIKEWLPTLDPQFVATTAFDIFAAAAALTLAAMGLMWRRLTVTDVILVASFLGLALQRNRHVVWFGFVALVVVAGLAGRSSPGPRLERGLRLTGLAATVAALCASMTFGNARGAFPDESASNNFTAAMITELDDSSIRGNVFNSYELGGELVYRDWPRLKPSIDSRIDSYGDAYFLQHHRALADEQLLTAFLDGWRVDHMLLLRRDFEGIRQMRRIGQTWHVRFADQKMLLLERNVPLPD